MLNKIIEDWNVDVHPLFIRKGARAGNLEEKAFDFFMFFYRKRFPKNIKKATKLDYEIPPKNIKKNLPKELALTQGHPLRNSTMQNLAVMYAVSLNENVTFDIILNNPDKPWNWVNISMNPNITWNIIKDNLD